MRKYSAILYKGLKHPQILVFEEALKPILWDKKGPLYVALSEWQDYTNRKQIGVSRV